VHIGRANDTANRLKKIYCC